jgi:hypothetical protein
MVQLIAFEEQQLCVTEPVMIEVLAGARNDQREFDLRRCPRSSARRRAATV